MVRNRARGGTNLLGIILDVGLIDAKSSGDDLSGKTKHCERNKV